MSGLNKEYTKACQLCCTKVKNLSVHFGKKKVLENVNLHFHCGQLTAVIGPNGAGKSTLIRAILGLIPSQGALHFLDGEGKRANKPVIGYVPQNLDFDKNAPISVYDLFASTTSKFPVWLKKRKVLEEKVQAQLKKVQAEHLIHERLGDLSGGQLQRVLLALALSPLPDILILDEPVSGVDHKGLEIFYGLLDQLRKDYDLTILLVSHDLPLMKKFADQVILLKHKVLIQGTPNQVFKSQDFIELFGEISVEAFGYDKNNGQEKGMEDTNEC